MSVLKTQTLCVLHHRSLPSLETLPFSGNKRDRIETLIGPTQCAEWSQFAVITSHHITWCRRTQTRRPLHPKNVL